MTKQEKVLKLTPLEHCFGVDRAPADTTMREHLDSIPPSRIKKVFQKIFSIAQRGKDIESYQFLEGHYLVSLDGTGFFSSKKIDCDNCSVKNRTNGEKECYHQMLTAVMVHPEKKSVIPLFVEEISKQDGERKNDCERNASKRLLETLLTHHPHLQMIIVEDALYANGPHRRLLKKLNMNYIIGVKPRDHQFLFDWVKATSSTQHEHTDAQGTHHFYSFVNDIPLSDEHYDLKVNFLEYWETDQKGRKNYFTWITNIPITIHNVRKIMQGGRARWRIENEMFNTLKNQGYHFEHNYGYGNQYLCNLMAHLMMLAFLIDQV